MSASIIYFKLLIFKSLPEYFVILNWCLKFVLSALPSSIFKWYRRLTAWFPKNAHYSNISSNMYNRITGPIRNSLAVCLFLLTCAIYQNSHSDTLVQIRQTRKRDRISWFILGQQRVTSIYWPTTVNLLVLLYISHTSFARDQ